MTLVADAADLIGQNGSIYFAIAGGFDKLFDADFDAGVATGTINFNPGWIGALAIGTYISQNLRAEIEVSRQSVFLDDEVINGLGRIDLSGDVQVIAVMAKIDYDFDLGSIRPFVGAGIGVANFAVDLEAPVQFEDSDSVLAGMVEAGIGVPLTPDIEAFGKAPGDGS
jgi:opacity protein-like surface antigen